MKSKELKAIPMKACERERYIFPVKKLGLRDNSAGKSFYMADASQGRLSRGQKHPSDQSGVAEVTVDAHKVI